jgi:Fe-S-cluster-containing dehydrogenase component
VAHYGMLIDLRMCAQCSGCTVACQTLYERPPNESGVFLHTYETGGFPAVERTTLPVQCMHCQDPPCVGVCPTGASYQDRATGTVQIDAGRCVGCRYCIVACPYGARQYDRHAGVVTKCMFCIQQVAAGLEPACVEICIGHARIFGDLDDPNSDVSKAIAERHAQSLRAELGTQPSIYYVF